MKKSMIFTAIDYILKRLNNSGEAAYDKVDIALSAITIQQTR